MTEVCPSEAKVTSAASDSHPSVSAAADSSGLGLGFRLRFLLALPSAVAASCGVSGGCVCTAFGFGDTSWAVVWLASPSAAGLGSEVAGRRLGFLTLNGFGPLTPFFGFLVGRGAGTDASC